MTSEEFTKHEANRAQLLEALGNPILQTALAILKQEMEPTTSALTDANPVVGAAKFHQVAGANHILQGLGRLTQPYKAPVVIRGKQLLPEQSLN
jgi:hypothetical protein